MCSWLLLLWKRRGWGRTRALHYYEHSVAILRVRVRTFQMVCMNREKQPSTVTLAGHACRGLIAECVHQK